MKNEKIYNKITLDAFKGNVTEMKKNVDKILSMKANVQLNKENTALFNKIFK